jgi:benzoylformate decarboxylase
MANDGRMTVRDATLALLRAHGMTTIFGNPGSTELPMFRDFPSDFRYILGLQESVVIGMADGFAQATRAPTLVNLHSAAGVGHALGNIFTAWKNRTPLVVTAGQQARSILPYDPFLFAQDATLFPKPYVKWAVEPARAEDVPAAIARAIHIALQPPCGPTFVSIPVDDWDRLCDPVEIRRLSHDRPGESALLDEAALALAQADRPAFVVGAGVALDQAWDAVIALAERHEARVFVSPHSPRNSFPEDHRLFAGHLPAFREPIVAKLGGHDLILLLGAPLFTYHAEGFGPHLPEGAKAWQIVDDPDQAAWSPVGTAIVGTLRASVERLLTGPSPRARETLAALPRAEPLPATGPLTDSYLMQRIAALRPADSKLVEEAPSTRGPMQKYLPTTRADEFYTCASGGLGHGLPASVGVAMGSPGVKTIALIGDGSAMYAIQALWSAAQLDVDLAVIIVNNARYEALINFGRAFGLQETVGTKLPEIDFVGIAQGQGVPGERVETIEALDAALTTLFTTKGPRLLEVMVD